MRSFTPRPSTLDELQQMPELVALGAQVGVARLGGRDLERHALHDLEAVAGEADVLVGIVGHQAHPAHAEVAQDLGADAVVALVGGKAELLVRLDRVVPLLLELVGPQLVDQADAPAFLEQVEQDPAPLRLDLLEREVFGPILHVVRYAGSRLDAVIDAINRSGYGLTLGIHSRIDATVRHIQRRARVGNTYVNRNQIGAVVGVQPFGGEGLSGTGPKAGGPHYLYRFAVERTFTVNTAAVGGNAALLGLGDD